MLRSWNRKKSSGGNLAIFDDLFPYRASGFRLVEYRYLLREFPRAKVYSTLSSLGWLGLADSRAKIIDSWYENDRDLASRLRLIEAPAQIGDADAFYTIFLNNAYELLPTVRVCRKPFAFTLYSGGGMRFYDDDTDARLREVLCEPMLHRVIVTQPAVLEYVTTRNLVPQNKIAYLYGAVVPGGEPRQVRRTPDGATLNICFAAHRYDPSGSDKGFDLLLPLLTTYSVTATRSTLTSLGRGIEAT